MCGWHLSQENDHNRHPAHCNLDEAFDLITACHDHPGVMLDSFHANIEEVSLGDCIWQSAETGRLFHVHIGDSNRRPPGQGHLGFAASGR